MENKIKIRLRLVIIKEDKLLGYYDSVENYYFYIGGKLEYGETIEEGCEREIKEELGNDAEFKLIKVLYIRDFILPEYNEHSLELYILGETNKFTEINKRPDPESGGKKWPEWLNLNELPDNLRPHTLSLKLVNDYKEGFPREGEYVGKIDC